MDMNQVLHECRTGLLRSLDARQSTFVSVGASGNWYFDWIHNSCGFPETHIGVEYYMPRPEGLPDNVKWVTNTAGNMSDVADLSADIMFSGQNIEHLWKEEVVGFLMEAHRVIKPGGLLVIDSPNRDITAAYNIPHPEHMVELTSREAADLLTLAGFDVEAVKGILLARDALTQTLIPYATADDTPPWSLVDRCVSAVEDPENSYIWWIHARRSARLPDRAAIEAFVDAYWAAGWPERMQRMQSNVGTVVSEGSESFVQAPAGTSGAMVYGPYAPIMPGTYVATVRLRLLSDASPETIVAHADVVVGPEARVLSSVEIAASTLSAEGYTDLQLRFIIEDMAFGYQSRVFSTGAAALSVSRRSDLVLQDQ